MKPIDQIWSDKIFYTTKSSRVLTIVAQFCSTRLLWMYAFATVVFAHAVFLHTKYQTASWVWAVLCVGIVMFIPWLGMIVLAYVIRRKRPFRAEHHKPLIYLPVETPSFPSAHATLAFALSSVFIVRMEALMIALLVACVVAVARVAVGVHYLSDILVGAFIGFVVGLIVFMNVLIRFM